MDRTAKLDIHWAAIRHQIAKHATRRSR